MDDALNLTSFEDQQPDLTNIVSTYIKKNIDVNDRLFKFEKSIKHLKDIDNKANGIRFLAPNRLLTRSLAHMEAGNNSYKLKKEIRQILDLLYQHNKITKKSYNSLIKSQ